MTAVEGSDSDVLRKRSLRERVLQRREFGVVIAILALLGIGLVVNRAVFATPGNMIGVLRNAATVSIIGYGMSMLMTAGEFDLSVGSLSAVAAGIVAVMISGGSTPVFAITIALVVAVIFGLTQGVIITKVGLPSLIITIGSLTLLRGVHFIITGNQSQGIPTGGGIDLLEVLGGVYKIPGLGLDFPIQIAWLLVLGLVLHYILFHTTFGYHTRFTGADAKSANYMKIPVDEVKILNFGLVAFLAAFAGIGQAVWAGSVSPQTGSGIELIVIAAVVIGGTDLFGGEGTILGVILGSLVFSFTQNILVLGGLGAQMFSVFTGIFIIGAVFIEQVATASFRELLVDEYVEPARELVLSPSTFFAAYRSRIETGAQAATLDLDGPLTFLSVNWLVASLLAVVVVNVSSFLLPLEFSLFVVTPGVGSVVTLPIVLFLLMALILLLVIFGVSIGNKLTGNEFGFLDATPITVYSLLPAVLLFLPVTLVGFSFIYPLIAVGVLAVAVPTLALLFFAVSNAFEASTSETVVSVGFVCLVLVGVAAFVAVNL